MRFLFAKANKAKPFDFVQLNVAKIYLVSKDPSLLSFVSAQVTAEFSQLANVIIDKVNKNKFNESKVMSASM